MTLAQATEWFNDGTVAAFAASVVFLAVVSFVFPWWQTLAGRSLVFIDLCWGASLLIVVLDRFGVVSTSPLFSLVWLAATLSLTAAVTVWRTWAVIVVHHRARRLLREELERERAEGGSDRE